MSVNVASIAQIARIAIKPEKLDEYNKKIQAVVDWVSEAQKVDCGSLQPMVYVNLSTARTYNSDNNPSCQKTEDILFNNKLQSANGANSGDATGDKNNYFKTILVVE